MNVLGMKMALIAALSVAYVGAESNYANQALSRLYPSQAAGLPTTGVLNGTVTELDSISSVINLNRTMANLDCSSGLMNVSLKFHEPFFGIVYANFNRDSSCKILGNGKLKQYIEIPLKGCGTLANKTRVFINNVVVRFHPYLEIDGDEIITIICRYPPPISVPPIIPAGLIESIAPVKDVFQPLPVILIICAIVFLSLLLFGISCSYYCLKKRHIQVVRRRPISTLGSDVTKLSAPISMFDGLKIPRAHATDTSGSEQLTASIISDFHSDVYSAESDEDFQSAYSDASGIIPEGVTVAQLHDPPPPGFDVQTVVKHAPSKGGLSPVSSPASSVSGFMMKAQEQYLTTILERTETNTNETLERVRHLAAPKSGPPPVQAKIRIHNHISDSGSGTETESEYSSAEQMHVMRQLRGVTAAQFDVNVRSKYDNAGFSHSEDDDTSTVISASEMCRGTYKNSAILCDRKREQELQQQTYRSEFTRHMAGPFRTGFDVLIRVLSQPSVFTNSMVTTLKGVNAESSDAESMLNETDYHRLQETMVNNRQFKEILENVVTAEEFIELRNNEQVLQFVEPQKWDVLIRILHNNVNFMEDSDCVSESTRSHVTTATGFSSGTNAQEVRSVTEEMVDFSNAARLDRRRNNGYDTRSMTSCSTVRGSGYARSVADRCESELYEYHHYQGSSVPEEVLHGEHLHQHHQRSNFSQSEYEFYHR